MIEWDDIASLIQMMELPQAGAFVAVDGRPASGKTTLALHLAEQIGAVLIHLDDFFLPKYLWPEDIRPAFPFPFFRIAEFKRCIEALASGRKFSYYAYDFGCDAYETTQKVLKPGYPIVVEGCSVLASDIVHFYTAKVFVKSDVTTEFAAITERENYKNLATWEKLFLPSVELYCQTNPWACADFIFKGRT